MDDNVAELNRGGPPPGHQGRPGPDRQPRMVRGHCLRGELCLLFAAIHRLTWRAQRCVQWVPTTCTSVLIVSLLTLLQQQQDRRPGDRQDLRKTRLCQDFMNTGTCMRGADCTFAHGSHELRQPPPMGPPRGQFDQRGGDFGARDKDQSRKTRLCEKFMQTGSCGYGDKCTFAHG